MTDGLFRETVRGVPNLPEVNGKYNDVTIAEQLVDSAVYRYVPSHLSRLSLNNELSTHRLFREPE